MFLLLRVVLADHSQSSYLGLVNKTKNEEKAEK